MTKVNMAERNMGRIVCPFCLSASKVHRNKSGRLYIHCPHDGPINVHGDSYQNYVEDNMTPYDEAPKPEPVRTEPEPESDLEPVHTEPEPEPEPAQDESEPEPDDLQDDDAGFFA